MPEPRIEERDALRYAARRASATNEAEFRSACDSGFPAVFARLGELGVAPAGPPFLRTLEAPDEGFPLEFEIGVPVTEPVEEGDGLSPRTLPAGRYATLVHVGPFTHAELPDLVNARAALFEWSEREGAVIAAKPTERGTAYEVAIDRFLTKPGSEPDFTRWETELAYLLA